MKLLISTLLMAASGLAFAEDVQLTRRELIDKITAQGVSLRGIERLYDFQDKNLNVPFVTDIYKCIGLPADDARACGERHRIYTTKTITITDHPWVVYIDFKKPSREKRFWLINLKTGAVESELVAHGAGSGNQAEPERFSNQVNSHMTSLGIYYAGETYRSGRHGTVLRLHGLERSNNNAYKRDVIFHGATYAQESYLLAKTNEKIGESQGCPAVSDAFAQKVIPLLKNGGIFFLDHEDLLDAAMSGNEVWLPTAKVQNPIGTRRR
jgi:hypothetical protein